jgi:hypothetical protein
VTADNGGFVLAAYVVTALVLGAYWRFLLRREKDLAARSRPR